MTKLIPIIIKNKKVLTTKQLSEVYETSEKNISNNFNNNIEHFEEGKHFYLLKGDELREFKRNSYDIGIAPSVNKLYLWTERGANRHCKILDTDKAWEQFDNLEETYFRVKIGQALTLPHEIIEELKEAKRYYKIQPRTVHEFTDYIKKRLNISKANEEFEQVKIMVFARLQISKWSDINLSERKSVLELIDNCVTKVKKERPYEQLSCFN